MKKIFIYLILFLFFKESNSQIDIRRYAIIDYIPLYSVVNNDIYDMLDSISVNLCDCIFYRLHNDYFYDIEYNSNTKSFRITVKSLNHPFVLKHYEEFPRKEKGTIFYNGKLVLLTINPPISKGYINSMLMLTDTIIDFKLLYELSLPRVGMGYEFAFLDAKYNSTDKKITIERKYDCDREHIYGYSVGEHDTWEDLSRKFKVSIEVLQTINGVKYDNLILKKDDYIYGRYYIENDSLKFFRIEENHY